MTVNQANLGPGTLAAPDKSVYAIPLSDWQNVNGYVQKITGLSPRVASHVRLFAPSFPKLESAAQKWKAETFPALIELSRSVHSYATVEVRTAYARLSSFLESPEDLDSFQQAMAKLIQEADKLAQRSATLGTDASQLALHVGSVMRELKQQQGASPRSLPRSFNPIEEIQQIGKALSELSGVLQQLERSPLTVLQYMQGSWLAIRDDLQAVLDIYADEFDADSAILTQYGIEHALDQWNWVAGEAKRFAEQVW